MKNLDFWLSEVETKTNRVVLQGFSTALSTDYTFHENIHI